MSLITDPWDDDDVQVEELDSRFKKIRTVQHRTVSIGSTPFLENSSTQIDSRKSYPGFLPKMGEFSSWLITRYYMKTEKVLMKLDEFSTKQKSRNNIWMSFPRFANYCLF